MTDPLQRRSTIGFSRNAPRERRGAVMVTALVCLLVVMAMIGTMLEAAIRARRQLHAERNLRQTELLLQAATDRAAFRLDNQADYQGETWEPALEDLPGQGQVTIEAARDSDTEPWSVQIVAEYPGGSEHSVRRSRTFLYQTTTPPDQE